MTKEKEATSDGEGKDVQVGEKKVLDVEQAPLLYIRVPGQYQQIPRSKRLKQASFVEQAVHFWTKEASFSEKIERVNYKAPEEVNPTHPVWTNLMSNIPWLPHEKRVYKVKREESRFKRSMRPEQKNTASMKNIMHMFTKPGNLVLVACTGHSLLTKLASFSRPMEGL